MIIACDEAGHTGPDLLTKEQRYFAFASINISDDEAFELIRAARARYPVQMPELKAPKLLSSPRGRDLVSELITNVAGRFAVNAHDKLLALCGWVFEYIFEPVYQDSPRIFYDKDFHRFMAMFCYIWALRPDSPAQDFLSQFQAYMRTRDTTVAPLLFQFQTENSSEQPDPFELLQRFATAHTGIIASDNSKIADRTPEGGRWTLDLSASSFWSHLSHWGKQGKPLTVLCDDSKPLKALAGDLTEERVAGVIEFMKQHRGLDASGWEFAKPVEFVDSRSHPAIQLADVLAGTVAYAYSRGMPDGMEHVASILDVAMLRDSIFPDFDRLDLKGAGAVNYAVLYELAMTAEGKGTGLPIEAFFEVAEQGVASGDLRL